MLKSIIIWTALMVAFAQPVRMSITATDPLAFNHHWKQAQYELSTARFNFICKGRRSGGTQIAKRRGIIRSMRNTFWPDYRSLFVAPTHQQAKEVWWDDLKRMLHKKQWGDVKVIQDISESDRYIKLINGSILKVVGLDKPERVEGYPINWVYCTEAANIKEVAIVQHIMPMLTERLGGMDLESAPEGRNYFYRECMKAMEIEQKDYMFHTWTTEEILPLYLGDVRAEEEIKAARGRMSVDVYDQEYRAKFIHFDGNAYYNFNRKIHAVKTLRYDPLANLHLCFDFNIAPGVCIAIQESSEQTGDGAKEDCTMIIGCITIPRNSTTPAVCRKIAEQWGSHKGSVFLYGDATGASGGSAKVIGSDWDIIVQMLRKSYGVKLYKRLPRANPRERDRVNAVNSRFLNANGEHKMLIDPRKAADVATDFDEVVVLRGGAGEIDKKINPERTHHSDAVGYYIDRRFPVRGGYTLKHQAM